MRRDELRDTALYLNMHPCRPAAGCHENIEKALPPGWRVVSASIGGADLRTGADGTVDLTGRTGRYVVRFVVRASRAG